MKRTRYNLASNYCSLCCSFRPELAVYIERFPKISRLQALKIELFALEWESHHWIHIPKINKLETIYKLLKKGPCKHWGFFRFINYRWNYDNTDEQYPHFLIPCQVHV